jgi:ATP adenylyltransferase
MASSEQYPHCEICPIIESPSLEEIDRIIHEGDAWRVALRDNQALLGTSFITLKDHKESLVHLSPEEDQEFIDIRNRLIGAVGLAFAPDVINLSCLMNYAFRDNDDPYFTPQPHVHYHFKPRYSSPRTIGDETFIDPEFSNYLRLGRNHPITAEMGQLIVAHIQENF